MKVYPEISSFAGSKAAVYIGVQSFSNLVLRSFRNSINGSIGKTQKVVKSPYVVIFDRVVGMTGGISNNDLKLEFDSKKPDIFLESPDQLDFLFSFGIVDSKENFQKLTNFTISLSKINFEIHEGNDFITCSGADAEVSPSFQRSANFNDIVSDNSLDKDEVTRIEGMLLYSGLATALTKPFAEKHTIDLKLLFPGVLFVGGLKFSVTKDRKTLLLKGASGTIVNPDGGCPCVDIGNGIGEIVPGVGNKNDKLDPNTEPDPNTTAGNIGFGGPSPVDPNSNPNILGHRRRGEGETGVYLPKAEAQAIVDGPFPGFRTDIRDNGFIGWKAAAFVDFNDLDLSLDPSVGALFVDLSFRAEVYGSVHVDLGKLGKVRVTNFSTEQKGPGANQIRIGFYLVVGSRGIYLKPVIEKIDFGKFEVFLRVGTLIGTPFGGWGAVIGFIFDVILAELISSAIPYRLDEKLRDYMGKAIFPILNANYAYLLESSSSVSNKELVALFDGDPDGLLISYERGG